MHIISKNQDVYQTHTYCESSYVTRVLVSRHTDWLMKYAEL